jgi:hypothetical protein
MVASYAFTAQLALGLANRAFYFVALQIPTVVNPEISTLLNGSSATWLLSAECKGSCEFDELGD